MSDVDTGRPVLRLIEECLANRRATHLLVRMAIQDQVDSRHLARDSCRDILTRYCGRDCVVTRGLVESGVKRHPHDIGARGSRFFHCISDSGNDVAEAQPAPDVLRVP